MVATAGLRINNTETIAVRSSVSFHTRCVYAVMVFPCLFSQYPLWKGVLLPSLRDVRAMKQNKSTQSVVSEKLQDIISYITALLNTGNWKRLIDFTEQVSFLRNLFIRLNKKFTTFYKILTFITVKYSWVLCILFIWPHEKSASLALVTRVIFPIQLILQDLMMMMMMMMMLIYEEWKLWSS